MVLHVIYKKEIKNLWKYLCCCCKCFHEFVTFTTVDISTFQNYPLRGVLRASDQNKKSIDIAKQIVLVSTSSTTYLCRKYPTEFKNSSIRSCWPIVHNLALNLLVYQLRLFSPQIDASLFAEIFDYEIRNKNLFFTFGDFNLIDTNVSWQSFLELEIEAWGCFLLKNKEDAFATAHYKNIFLHIRKAF